MVAKLDNGKYELRFEQNYGGVVDALVDAQLRSGDRTRNEIEAYTSNFAGIIAAIQDLSVNGNANTGPTPPGWVPDGTDDGEYPVSQPIDGDLWFDTRQGRLYVYKEDNWYQTNGADGYCWVNPVAPSNPVTGQLWMDTDNNNQLYVYNANTYVDPTLRRLGGETFDANSALFSETWVPIAGGGTSGITNTGNLPLEYPTVVVGDARSIIEWPDASSLTMQSHYNQWILSAFTAVDEGLTKVIDEAGNTKLFVGELPPEDSNEGSLWFDSIRLDLNVYYDEQWVSVGAPSDVVFNGIAEVNSRIDLTNERIDGQYLQVLDIYERLTNNLNTTNTLRDALNSRISLLQNDIYGFIKIEDVTTITDAIDARLTAEEQRTTDLSGYATTAELNALEASINASMYDHATEQSVDNKIAQSQAEVIAQIPDITGKADTTYVDQQINALDFLPATGGTIDGFKFHRGNISVAGLDFSNRVSDGIKAFAFKANGATTTNSFGVGSNPFEMAWQFQSDEDYCWIHGSNKVASITKNGISCSNLQVNTIDVRDQLEKYQAAFTALRASASQAVDFESLKASIVTALAGV